MPELRVLPSSGDQPDPVKELLATVTGTPLTGLAIIYQHEGQPVTFGYTYPGSGTTAATLSNWLGMVRLLEHDLIKNSD